MLRSAASQLTIAHLSITYFKFPLTCAKATAMVYPAESQSGHTKISSMTHLRHEPKKGSMPNLLLSNSSTLKPSSKLWMKSISDIRRKLLDASCVWMFDGTVVYFILGKWRKAFCIIGDKSGGYEAVSPTYLICKHIIAIIVGSAAGVLTPPFFITVDKQNIMQWFGFVSGRCIDCLTWLIKRFTEHNWSSEDELVTLTDKRSIDGST